MLANGLRLFALTAICASAPCGATIVTVDPNSYARGTDLSNAYDGVTISVQENRPGSNFFDPINLPARVSPCGSFGCTGSYGSLNSIGGSIYSTDYLDCRSSSQGFGCNGGWRLLVLDFDQGADFVEIRSLRSVDPAVMMAFDSSGGALFGCSGTWGPFDVRNEFGCTMHSEEIARDSVLETYSVRSESPNIARVIFGSFLSTTTALEATYSASVPEPGSLALLMLALTGIGLMRRKTQREMQHA